MIRNAKTLFIKDFTGGINNTKGTEIIDDNQLISGIDFSGTQNVYYKNGCLKKTKGYTKVNSTSINDIGIAGFRWYFTNLGTGQEQIETICAFKNSTTNDINLYRLSGSSFTLISGGSTINNATNLCFVSWKNNLYIATGVTPIQKITVSGTTWTRTNLTSTTMSLTNPSWVTIHKDRLWINGTGDGQIGQIECSGYDDDANWSGTEGDIFNTNYGDGDPITAIKSLNDKLIIYKHNSIWIMEGDNLYNWVQRSNQKEIGCIAPYSIQEVNNTHIFLGEDNIYMFDGNNILPIGDDILGFFDNINKSNLDKIVSTIYDGYYYLAIQSTAEDYNNKEILLSIELLNQQKKSFFLINGRPIAYYITYTGANDSGEFYAVSSKEGYLYKINYGYTYDNEPIRTIIQTKFFNFDALSLIKEYSRLRINTNRDYNTATISLIRNSWYEYQWNYTINLFTSSYSGGYWDISNWDETNWGPTLTSMIIDIAIPSQLDGYSLGITITNSDNSEFALYNMMLIGTLKEI